MNSIASVRTDLVFQVVKNEPVMRLVRVGSGTSSLPDKLHRDWVVSHHRPLRNRARAIHTFHSRSNVESDPHHHRRPHCPLQGIDSPRVRLMDVSDHKYSNPRRSTRYRDSSLNSFAEICFHAGPEERVPCMCLMTAIVGAVVIPIGFREGRRLVV